MDQIAIHQIFTEIHLIFHQRLSSVIGEFHGDFIIMGGDFNLVQNIESDYYRYKHIGNQKAREIVLEMIEKFNYQILGDHNMKMKNDILGLVLPVKKADLTFFLCPHIL